MTRGRFRHLAGLTIRDLADRTGISKTRLSAWEMGEAELHTSELRNVHNVLLELLARHFDELARIVARQLRNTARSKSRTGKPRRGRN